MPGPAPPCTAILNTSPGTNGVSPRYWPLSRISATPPGWNRNENLISFGARPVVPDVSPMARTVFVSEAVNSMYPLPEGSCSSDTAPASAQPSHPVVFCSELPFAVVLTSFVQTTFFGAVGALWALLEETTTSAALTGSCDTQRPTTALMPQSHTARFRIESSFSGPRQYGEDKAPVKGELSARHGPAA